jgi:hypothetical protein
MSFELKDYQRKLMQLTVNQLTEILSSFEEFGLSQSKLTLLGGSLKMFGNSLKGKARHGIISKKDRLRLSQHMVQVGRSWKSRLLNLMCKGILGVEETKKFRNTSATDLGSVMKQLKAAYQKRMQKKDPTILRCSVIRLCFLF